MTLSPTQIADSLVGFDAFSGERPGGHFFQFEAWEGRKIVVQSTATIVQETIYE